MTIEMSPVIYNPEERIQFHMGAEIDGEFCFVGGFASQPRFEPYNRVLSYKPDRTPAWMYVDFETYICDMCTGRYDATSAPGHFFLVSREGEIWGQSQPGLAFAEVIPGAGEIWDTSEGYGDIYCLHFHRGTLLVGGASGQVYQKIGRNGQWERISSNLLGKPREMDIGFNVSRLCVASDGRTYALGYWPAKRPLPGRVADTELFLLEDDGSWRSVARYESQNVYFGLTALPDGQVLFGGSSTGEGGTGSQLLQGNPETGFREVGREGVYAVGVMYGCMFEDEYYAAGAGRLAKYQPPRLEAVTTGLVPEHDYASFVSTNGEALLSVGYNDIVRFDSLRWERIYFPGNPPITSATRWDRY